jgi:hypothetical protein
MSTIKTNAIQTVAGKPILNSTGSILQVVQTVKTDTFSTGTAQSWVNITGLSISITPSSTSSKILFLADIQGSGAGSYSNLVFFKILRNGGDISGALGNSRSGFNRAAAGHQRASLDANSCFRAPLYYLDSPASTSAVTYQLQGLAELTGFVINRTAADGGSQIYSYTAISSITAMEVSA